jgi:hypothetical protein
MTATSFNVAWFNASHHHANPYRDLVDLATALEAVRTGGEGDGSDHPAAA